ncbi:MAG: aldehyde reductase [Myxococcota bacterium]|nr:aldehyde reductase [Myxococcota bacterium]
MVAESTGGMGGGSGERVLVTGGSGFIGAHCILQLLEAGYRVRTTVRSAAREADVRSMLDVALHPAGPQPREALSFARADLLSNAGWPEAVAGCDFVLHVASPFPLRPPRHEDELILPAREGTLRVLRAAQSAGVRRVVLTSSFAAIGYGHGVQERPFSEESWTDPGGPGVSAYSKSKTLAERAAWDFVASDGGALELAVVNPVAVFGPVFGRDYSTSIQIVQRLLDGTVPGLPRVAFGIVDARDVADLHLRAMVHPRAKGERFLAVAGDSMTVRQVAELLKARMGDAARRVPTRMLPDWLLRLAALVDSSIAQIVPELGAIRNATSEKARRVLGWAPRSNEEAILATAESLVRLGLLRRSKRAGGS